VGALERELALVRDDGAQAISLALRAVAGRHETLRTLVMVSAGGDRGLAAAASQARAAGVNLAAVLVGPARAYASDLRRAGTSVTEVSGASDLAAALGGSRVRAQLV
jgi:hypothetical protein